MDIYPVHLLDNADNYRKLFMSYIFQFNDALDGQKLADSLSGLLQIGEWRKLGGRLRFNKDGKLEIHVPFEFSLKEPAIAFSQDIFHTNVNEHPAGQQLPDLSGHQAMQQLSADVRTFAGPNTPRSMTEMMDRDAPLLSLHVTCFADATIVGISWPHVVMDAMGLQALLRNWSLVLSNKSEHVLPLVGVHDDPLQEAVESDSGPKEALVVEKLAIGAIGIIVLLFRLLWMKLWSPGFSERTIILTKDRLNKLCTPARKEVDAQGDETAFISDGDVLAAWAAHMLAASQPKPSPVTVACFINVRFRLSALNDKGGEYMQNLLQFVYASFPPGCAEAPLGLTALSYRQQLAEQSTEPQILSYLRMQRDHVKAKGSLRLVFGDPHAAMLTVNNLAKVDFFRNIDFSAAVVGSGQPAGGAEGRQNPPGTIVYFNPLVLNEPAVVTSHLRVLGKDHSGKVMFTGTFEPKTWELIDRELQKL